MCNNCNCDDYELCSIVGNMPVGFCCSRCYLHDENCTCLKMKTKRIEVLNEKEPHINPIRTTIENGMLKVVIEQEDKEIPIYIDLKKQLSLE